jgi:hypothetical protein
MMILSCGLGSMVIWTDSKATSKPPECCSFAATPSKCCDPNRHDDTCDQAN